MPLNRRETPVEGDVQLRRVPIALAAGWGGLDMPPVLRAASLVRLQRADGSWELSGALALAIDCTTERLSRARTQLAYS